MLYAFGAGEVPISVSGGGEAGGRVGHTIRAVGAATSALCAIEPGAQVGVRGPFGNSWPLAEAEGGDVVVVAGGIGLAPLRLAINHLIANRDSYRAVSLLYGARSPDEVLYPTELQRWREAGINVATTRRQRAERLGGPGGAGHHADPGARASRAPAPPRWSAARR